MIRKAKPDIENPCTKMYFKKISNFICYFKSKCMNIMKPHQKISQIIT